MAQNKDSLPPTPLPLSNLRNVVISPESDTLQLDSLTIIPETLVILNRSTGETLDKSFYKIEDNKLIWLEKQAEAPLEIRYRVFPYAFSAVQSRKDTAWIGYEGEEEHIIRYEPAKADAGVFNYQGLDYSGSFSRGVSFGNNQDLVLNSSFNLQLSGNIGDDIEILAAITDNNIPLQPEGNTQQLQEFDQIFIQLKRKNTVLIAGDYQLSRPKGYFMNYYKRLQGASLTSKGKIGEKGILSGRASGAVQRGQFARNSFNGQEGNQGPYKLTGNSGERFLIVLAGTERVYIDGQLLIRGSENDYIIDYNTGELTFTTNQLITKDKRIVVEFSYSTDSYVRTLYGANLVYEQDKFSVYFNQFSEQDGKNQVSGQELTAIQRQTFQQAGDQVESTLFPSLDTTTYDVNRIQYKLIDTTVSGIAYDSVFVYSTVPDEAIYLLTFTEVGQNQGRYKILESTVNGRIYEWVADSLGIPQGSYEPVIRLSSPKRKQLYTAGLEYKLTKTATINAEIALSNNDKNTFSDIQDEDNAGLATNVRYNHVLTLGDAESKEKTTFTPFLNYEFASQNFAGIDPYRAVEFKRDWNADTETLANEHIAKAGFELRKLQWGKMRYEFGTFLQDTFYTGTKHFASTRLNRKGFALLLEGSYLEVKAGEGNSQFFRPKFDFSKTFKKLNNWKAGIYGEREKNQRFANNAEELQSNSFFYDLFKSYISNTSSENFQFEASYLRRFDYTPDSLNFVKATTADEFNLNGLYSANRRHRLNWNLTYRNLHVEDTTLTTQNDQQTYLGRVEYGLTLKGGFIRSNTVYELGAGQQQKLEFSYLETTPGQGTYIWIDRDSNMVQQLDEFEEATFQNEANFIRITTFTNQFIRTNNVLFTQSLSINPSKFRREKELGKSALFFRRFSTQTVFRISRKTLESEQIQPWYPFQLNLADSTFRADLVTFNSNIRNSLFFNRTDPKYGMEFGVSDNRNHVSLISGLESRLRTEYFTKARWNITRKIGTNFTVSGGHRLNRSEAFESKNYQLEYYNVEPQLTALFNKNFRIKFKYKYQKSFNLEGDEAALKNDFRLETTYNRISKTEIRSNISFAMVNYTGEKNTPVSYAILEGLQNGKNYLWNLIFDRRIAKNVLLSMSYEGRKTGDSRMVHVGRATVRATF